MKAQVLSTIFESKNALETYPALKQKITKSIPRKTMQQVNVAKLKEEDKLKEGMGDVPFRFGYGFDVNYTLEDGIWEQQDSVNVWSLKITSSGAYSLNFIFEQLFLAKGAQLYIFNSDESMVYGPVTEAQNESGETFLTDIVAGDEVVVQLIEPKTVEKRSFLKISKSSTCLH
jgi:hypothetical protein